MTSNGLRPKSDGLRPKVHYWRLLVFLHEASWPFTARLTAVAGTVVGTIDGTDDAGAEDSGRLGGDQNVMDMFGLSAEGALSSGIQP